LGVAGLKSAWVDPSPRLRFHQIDSAVHRVSQFLLAAEIALGRPDRDMPEQKLNLLQFSAGEVTHGRDQADFRVQIRPNFLERRLGPVSEQTIWP